jgi:hypothetical protein
MLLCIKDQDDSGVVVLDIRWKPCEGGACGAQHHALRRCDSTISVPFIIAPMLCLECFSSLHVQQ